jgi:hypothetical protein
MTKETMVFMHTGVLFSYKEEHSSEFCRKMDGTKIILLWKIRPTQKDKHACFLSYA